MIPELGHFALILALTLARPGGGCCHPVYIHQLTDA